MNSTVIELIGYVGSALVVVSMLMTSVVRLRVINMIGSIIFTCYALIIRSYPTAFMNLCLVAINIYHLFRLLKETKNYDLVEAAVQDRYISYLEDKNKQDIRSWFPEFKPEGNEADTAFLVLHDSNPAGLLLGRQTRPGELEVVLDYTTPVYRDATVGRFLHDSLAKKGYKKLVFKGNAPGHIPYMEKVGYQKNNDGVYELALK